MQVAVYIIKFTSSFTFDYVTYYVNVYEIPTRYSIRLRDIELGRKYCVTKSGSENSTWEKRAFCLREVTLGKRRKKMEIFLKTSYYVSIFHFLRILISRGVCSIFLQDLVAKEKKYQAKTLTRKVYI